MECVALPFANRCPQVAAHPPLKSLLPTLSKVVLYPMAGANAVPSNYTLSDIMASCQVRVYSGRGSGQVRTKADEGEGQRAGQEISPARVGDCLDSTTKDNER